MGIIKKPEPVPYFDCGKCGVTFDNFDEYEDHCKADAYNHTQEVPSTDCIICHKIVTNVVLPFTKELEKTPAICDECLEGHIKPTLKASGRL